MIAGSLTLSFNAGTNTFSVTVSPPYGFMTTTVSLQAPNGSGYPMMGGGNNWTLQMGMPGQGAPPAGTWTAKAMMQGMADCSGTTNV